MWGHEQNYTAKVRKPPTPQLELFSLEEESGGGLPAPLSEVAGRQGRLVRHIVEDLGSVCPFVQILDLPVPQMVGDVTDTLRILDFPIASRSSKCPRSLALRVHRVLLFLSRTVLSPTHIALQIAEQIFDTPVPQGRGGKRRVQGILPEQSSTATSSFLERISERTAEQIVDIPSSGGGLGQGSSSSAGPEDEDFTGFSHFSTWKKVRSAGQVVSAQLGGHVSSSTLSAHQMARAGEPADSDGSIEWVLICPPDISKSYHWNRRTNLTAWELLAGVQVVWLGELTAGGDVCYWNQVTGLSVHTLPPLPPQ